MNIQSLTAWLSPSEYAQRIAASHLLELRKDLDARIRAQKLKLATAQRQLDADYAAAKPRSGYGKPKLDMPLKELQQHMLAREERAHSHRVLSMLSKMRKVTGVLLEQWDLPASSATWPKNSLAILALRYSLASLPSKHVLRSVYTPLTVGSNGAAELALIVALTQQHPSVFADLPALRLVPVESTSPTASASRQALFAKLAPQLGSSLTVDEMEVLRAALDS